MAKYQVFDSGRPADSTGHPQIVQGMGWDNSIFDTFKEAADYANSWLGGYANLVYNLELNTPIDYSGSGDTIEIRETEG